MGGGGILWMALTWIIIIGLSIWFVTWLTRRDKSVERAETPRQILDRRLASGEIDATAYAQARRLIDGHSAGGAESK
ncbi:MAG: hypothetical protein HY050_04075 [Actinobacteria bacterium]|nr:hypothetical protein [Actinomycetota bacterium]